MSHHGGGGGGHGHMGGHHPDQSPGWNQAMQGEKGKAITSLPNPTIVPIFGALLVFGIMLLPFVVNWGDGGIELPWVTQQRENAAREEQAKGRDNVGQINSPAPDPVDALTASFGGGAPGAASRPQASIDQQLLFASQQGSARQQAAPQAYSQSQPYSAETYNQTYGQNSYPQQSYGQQNYGQAPYGQPSSNYAQGGAYQNQMQQPPQRHRVWVDR